MNKDLEQMFNIKLTKCCCENCHFNQEGICKFNNELIKESKECDYFIDKEIVFETVYKTAMEMKKIKNMIEKPDFQKKMDVFIERSQDLKEQKSLEEHAKQLEENFEELFDGVNVFGRAKEEILKELTLYKDFAKLFFDVFELKYENDKFTLTLKPYEQYNIENINLKVCITKKDADKILKVAELLEQENDIQ